MVIPKFPFSLFDFKHIDKFGPLATKIAEAAAGAAIPETVIYTCPDYKFALILQASVVSTKTTSTAFTMAIIRAKRNNITGIQDWLLIEDLGTSESVISWPMSKPTTSWCLGWTLVFLFPGDTIKISHALTAAETIEDKVEIIGIEYSDPRYPYE